MVAHLHKYAVFQAFSYIGVSKLSCKACQYWMEAFNNTMSTKFRTNGLLDKWYGGWARPGLGELANQGKVDAMFLAFVEGELCKHQLGKRMARMTGSNGLILSKNQLPHKVDIAALVKKYGRIFEWLK